MSKVGWRREPARHSLAARGVKTARPKPVFTAMARDPDTDQLKPVSVPPILYHGTPLENLDRVLEEGIRVGTDPNPSTIEMGHEDDTWSNVSMANKLGDAIFFVVAANMSRGNIRGGQAIFEVDMTSLPDNPCGRRPLFSKPGHYEFKYYTQTAIPPSAIKRIYVRKFDGSDVFERWYTPEEWKAERRGGAQI